MYPADAPLVYLDEPEDKQVVDMVDYLDQGNVIMFQWLINWGKQQQSIFNQVSVYNLISLLGEVFKLFTKMPPVSFEELFGSAVIDEPERQAPNEQWEDIPAHLLDAK